MAVVRRGLVGIGLVALVAAVGVSGGVGAQATGPGESALVTLYGHIFALGNDERGRLVNAQFPEGEQDFSLALGNLGSFSTGGYAVEYRSTAGLVQIKSREEFAAGGADRLHPETGFTKPIRLDTERASRAFQYFSVDDVPVVALGSNNGDDIPHYFPDLDIDWGYRPQTSVTTRVFVDGKVGESNNPTVTEGRSATVDMLSLPETIPGMTFVYEFEIPLAPAAIPEVPTDPGDTKECCNLRFRTTIASLYDGAQNRPGFGINAIAINSGEAYPPRWELWVKNPLDVELVYPKFVGDKLVVLGIFNSPFGSYDIDLRTVAATWEGPTQPKSVRKPVLDYSVAHGGHYDPVNATWAWDFKADGAAPGPYKVTISAMNRQHTASTSTDAFFTIEKTGAGKTQSGTSGVQTLRGDAETRLPTAGGGDGSAARTEPTPQVKAKEKESGFLPGFEALAAFAALGAAAAGLGRRRP